LIWLVRSIEAQPFPVMQLLELQIQAMGTTITLKAYVPKDLDQSRLTRSFTSKLDSLVFLLSDYEDYNLVQQLATLSGKGSPLTVDRPLIEIMQTGSKIFRLTHGKFDVTIGKVTHFWREQFRRGRIPSRKKMKRMLRYVGMDKVRIDSVQSSLYLSKRGMELDFGGIGKGYIGDQLAAHLENFGVHSFLIDLGGDLIAGDPPPSQVGWKIRCEWLSGELIISNEALATSGPDYQFFYYRGARYSHIIDPHTGWAIKAPATCTVIANNGSTADAMASALPLLDELSIQALQKELNLSFALVNLTGLISSPDFVTRIRKL